MRLFFLIATIIVAFGCQQPAPTAVPEQPSPKPAPPIAPAPVEKVAAPPAAVYWPTYHGNTTLDGVADIAFPDALAQVWQFDAGAEIANPAVSGTERIFFTNIKGAIFAVDLKGQQIWSKTFTEPLG